MFDLVVVLVVMSKGARRHLVSTGAAEMCGGLVFYFSMFGLFGEPAVSAALVSATATVGGKVNSNFVPRPWWSSPGLERCTIAHRHCDEHMGSRWPVL